MSVSSHIISLLLVIFFVSHITALSSNNKIITIMGASCSGKSTLSENLFQTLEYSWKLVELDVIEEELKKENDTITENEIINAMINQINKHLENGYNVLIDTNMYDVALTEIVRKSKLFVWIYSPLHVLLERDNQRNCKLQRPEKRAYNA